MRDQLDRVEYLAAELKLALENEHVTAALGPGIEVSAIWSGLHAIEFRAQQAREAVRKGGGRSLSRVQWEIEPRTICAVIVTVAFAYFQNQEAKGSNKAVQTAAEGMWRASGGEPFSGHSGSIQSWRPYFDLKQMDADPGFREWVRWLIIRETTGDHR